MPNPSYRDETTRALREALVPEHPDAARLLDECLAAWPARHGAAWYPSAGDDYRDLLELASPRREANGLEIPVHLFVHTCIDPRPRDHSHVWYQDTFTQVCSVRSASFTLHPDVARTVGLRDAWFLPTDDPGPRRAHLLEVDVSSNRVGRFRAWLLYLELPNYDFFVRFVIERGLRFSTYIQACQGLGMGGCSLGTVYLTPWLAWAGCREMICDGELHGSAASRDRVFAAFRAAGAPLDPPSFRVRHHGRSLRWSDYPADAATLTPEPPIRPLGRALAAARVRLTHPRSRWRSIDDDFVRNPSSHGADRPMFRVFPTLHPSLPLIEVDGSTYLLDTGATHSLGTAAPGASALGHLLARPEAMTLAQLAWPLVQQSAHALGYDGRLDGLVGVDRLAALDLLVDAPNGFVALRPRHDGADAPTDDGTQLVSERRHALPCVRLRFGDRTLHAVLDTGAALGYFVGDPPRQVEPGPEAVDHNPLVGRFTAPTFAGALSVSSADGEALPLGTQRLGRIGGLLEASLRMAGVDAVIGGALFASRAVRFTDALGRVDVLDAQVHDTLAPHYAPLFDDLYGARTLAAHGEHLATGAAAVGAQRVLDVGAGAGSVSLALRARGLSVVAVEPSRGMAGVLAQRLLRGGGDADAAVYLGGAEDLAALDLEPVDLVLFAFGVVDYLLDDESLHRALAGARARTRAGGRCWVQPAPHEFLTDAVQHGARYRREVRLRPQPRTRVLVCDHRVFLDDALVSEEQVRFRPRTLAEVRAVAEQAGWTDDGVDEQGIYPTLRLVRAGR